MKRQHIHRHLCVACACAALALPSVALAAQVHGQVSFNGFPVPGATVSVTQGSQTRSTVTDQGGVYSFADLPDGAWTLAVMTLGFAATRADLAVTPSTPAANVELALLPLDQVLVLATAAPPAQPVLNAATATPGKAAETLGATPNPSAAQDASDGLLVNGSVNNAATSKFSLDQAFGNKRNGSKSLYTGSLAAIFNNSALDARPYSLSGVETPKPSYNRFTGLLTLGGPLNIPHLLPHGPNAFLTYQWTRNRIDETESGLVPTAPERVGDLSGILDALGHPVAIYNPATGMPFAGSLVPVSAQARALLALYPLPNLAGNSLYNYQVPVLNSSHIDALQSRLDKSIKKEQFFGSFSFENTRSSSSGLLGFPDRLDTLGLDADINWSHRFNQRLFLNTEYSFSRQRISSVPFFQNRVNVSGDAGITGNNQNAAYWGPPTLAFSSGVTPLTDAQSSFNRNRTDAFSGSVAMYQGHHNITLGGELRKQQFNDLFQQDPRGTFTFTGAATQGPASNVAGGGSDIADFLLGTPDTSAIAFGNADKYLREPVYALYANDDWHALPDLTVNAGLRWQYGAPITELRNRLVNLDVLSNFRAVAPVLAGDPVGALTGSRYPTSLIRPDKSGFEPRIGVSWRPIPASTIVVRAGYGIYHDTSVYQAAALALAQQAPLSTSLSVQNSPTCPLTLAQGFLPCNATTQNTFAVDPNFRVGYAQTWQLAVQRDLPAALQLTVTYLGVKGTRSVQQFLPNTYPIGAANPPGGPAGFVYQASGGDSTRQAGQVQLRRRLRDGFTASLLYTFSKSIDDDASLGGQGHVPTAGGTSSSGVGSGGSGGGASGSTTSTSATPSAAGSTPEIAQNWLNLRGERSLSSFDQRHLLAAQLQYTSGEGLGGGTLLGGWRGKLLKEWTALTQITAGTGLPETPIYLAAVPGTGYTGVLRPDRTGAPISARAPGRYLNVAAFAAPVAGQFGSAGRNSITGPNQFNLDTSFARTFRLRGRYSLDARVNATNLLNHVVFTGWDTTVNSTQYGVPLAANASRSLESTIRLRF